MILTLASRKGGAGKTTVARAVAASWANNGTPVAVVDCDAGQALYRWCKGIYEGPPLAALHAETNPNRLPDLLHALQLKHKLVLVDTPGFAEEVTNMAITASDTVLIPCMASEADVYEAADTARRVEAISRATRRKIPWAVLMNRYDETQVARHALAQVEALGLRRLETTLGSRTAFAALSHSGVLPPGKAAEEVEKLMVDLKAEGLIA